MKNTGKKIIVMLVLLLAASLLLAGLAASVAALTNTIDMKMRPAASDRSENDAGTDENKNDPDEPNDAEVPSDGKPSGDEPDVPVDAEPDQPVRNEYPDAVTVSTVAVDSEYTVNAPYAALYDMTSDTLIMSTSSLATRIFPASTTKVLTALYTMTVCELDEVVTVGSEIRLVHSDASTAQLKIGEQYTVEQLLYAMMLRSGGDAVYAAATHSGRILAGNSDLPAEDAISLFMIGLNQYARSIGMLDTHFVTPDGYHDQNHYSTLYDILVMSKVALSNEVLVRITSTYKYAFNSVSGESHSYTNTNGLLNSANSYYVPGAIGLKTGTTGAAGSCLIGAAKSENDHVLIAVVFGAEGVNRFTTANKMLKHGFAFAA